MPLLKRKPIVLLPLPTGATDGSISQQEHVFYIDETGEVFLDYDSYAQRVAYLQQRIFTCEHTGKAGLDYFQAVASERAESKLVNDRFPDQLKHRVLAACNFFVCGRIDNLVDMVFDRLKDRYFAGERVVVDLHGDKLYGKIIKVYPPRFIRDHYGRSDPLHADSKKRAFDDMTTNGTASTSELPASDRYEAIAHSLGTDLWASAHELIEHDPSSEYLYTVQLMSNDGAFNESLTEAQASQLARDRNNFSKVMLKRFLRDSLQRDPALASPWQVKPSLCSAFGLPLAPDDEIKRKNEAAREASLAKRKKLDPDDLIDGKGKGKSQGEAGAKKQIKYPIEDLELEMGPASDSRERNGLADTHEPATKPVPRRDMPVPQEHMSALLMQWSMLQIFSEPLRLSPFSLDDFGAALRHDAIDVHCALTSEIHGCLLNALSVEPALAVYGTVSYTAASQMLPELSAEALGGLPPDIAEVYLRAAVSLGNVWPRAAQLDPEKDRKGWEHHLIGAICQRGGIETLPRIASIVRHLLSSLDDDPEDIPDNAEDCYIERKPQDRYPTLPLADKLLLLGFLIDLALPSRAIVNFMNETESYLSELRKERIEINKEKRQLIAERNAMDGKKTTKPKDLPDDADDDAVATLWPSQAEGLDLDEANGLDSSISHDARDESFEPERSSERELTPLSMLATPDPSPASAKSRAQVLKDKQRAREAEDKIKRKEIAAQKAANKEKLLSKKGSEAARRQLKESFEALYSREESLEYEWRRNRGVRAVIPLGKDRFYNSYWWFDGIGGQALRSSQGGHLYGTGRLFVLGPSGIDCDLLSDRGPLKIKSRRQREEGEALLETGIWGYYQQEDEFDALLSWLNSKGNRELYLKQQLTKWKHCILGGAEKRLNVRRRAYVASDADAFDTRI
ncbi:uncharacterized protein L969DRAFT_48254 [Mixia osmundae IAM 14324]|uniref:WAC domain-containing protein n=1 Tax=Mixia osmundae (strain CBS 9802 / IAM 14324 / JCM 22182 / KY 12970) TaxID=764103 RepID=G7E943_MIXOS|nr:uncharacterized protein L969DRAFT_48254 [Mixia osmundae IAM 14324]KEI40296.1 hypothetical protein L969DRAFT_48254 [Mixia osmundae IAM 14324]GAA99661.1 hypothetical protein E5Q_06364 [Mixia osmundae IAM 14324]